ncbi:MAG: hypothetical protein OEY49_19890, partial [Candidatus Heimdallarchaeota archaeon]|nr:hypothetical protein [Candidatus Heimdallarchaeota archaeon]
MNNNVNDKISLSNSFNKFKEIHTLTAHLHKVKNIDEDPNGISSTDKNKVIKVISKIIDKLIINNISYQIRLQNYEGTKTSSIDFISVLQVLLVKIDDNMNNPRYGNSFALLEFSVDRGLSEIINSIIIILEKYLQNQIDYDYFYEISHLDVVDENYKFPSHKTISNSISLLESSISVLEKKDILSEMEVHTAFNLSIELLKDLKQYNDINFPEYSIYINDVSTGIRYPYTEIISNLIMEVKNYVEASKQSLLDPNVSDYYNAATKNIEPAKHLLTLLIEIKEGKNKFNVDRKDSFQVYNSINLKPIRIIKEKPKLIPILKCVSCDEFLDITLKVERKLEQGESYYHHNEKMKIEVIESEKIEQYNKSAHIYHKLNEAIKLSESYKIPDLALSYQLYLEIISEKVDLLTQIQALMGMCQLHIYELKATGNQLIIGDIYEILDKLVEISSNYNIDYLFIETNLIRGRIQLLAGNIDELQELMNEIKTFVKEKNLSHYTGKIDSHQLEIEKYIEQSKSIVDSNTTILDRIHQSNIDNYLQNVMKLIDKEDISE